MEDPPEDKLLGAQLNEDKSVTGGEGGVRFKLNVLLTDPAAAVNTALTVLETVAAAALNLADTLPAGIVTLAGTDTLDLLLLRVQTIPPLGAFPLAVTVHVADPGVAIFAGEQENPFKTADLVSVIVPPEPDVAIPLPSAAPATNDPKFNAIEESGAFEAT